MSGISKRVSGSWVSDDYGIMKTATDTITTLPAVIYPTDTTATVGLKGNTVQNGTPTPDNPVMPQGTGERTGNLFDKENSSMKYYGYINSLTYEVVFSTSNSLSIIVPVKPNSNYTISKLATTRFRVGLFTNYPVAGSIATAMYGDRDGGGLDHGTTLSFHTSTNTTYIMAFVRNYNDTVTEKELMQSVVVNEGTTPLPYEPYGIKIPISSANTTTPVYLGEVETTRRIKKIVFKGSENWTLVSGTHGFYTQIGEALDKGTACIISSHYRASIDSTDGSMRIANNKREVLLFDNYASAAEYKAYLAQQYAAGTPVTVWYVLATPETGIVNEPLMRIGDYGDTLSNISIPVTAGGDTLSVDTTVQPSEVAVNYKGWHTVSDVHEFTSNYTVETMQALTIAQLQTHTISDLQGGGWL